MNPTSQRNQLRRQLKKHANPKRAQGEKRYLKSPWKFYGVNTPTKRQLVKNWFKKNDASVDDVAKLAQALWNSAWHEEKTLAVMFLHHKSKELTLKHMPLIEKMINEASGWDHLDEISIRLVGALIDKDKKTLQYLPKWTKSKNFWVRRASLLSQIPQFRREEGDKKLFFKLATPMFNEGKNWSKEERFFIRKAIGWVLREIAQKQPEIVFKFVIEHKNTMSGLALREATRKLPNNLQQKLGKK